MRYIIYLGLSLIGAVIVGATCRYILEPSEWIVYLVFGIGGLLGVSTARLFYRYVDRRCTTRSSPRPQCAHQSRLSFAERLSRFSGYDAFNRSDDFDSSMPFWTRYESYVPTPPRSSHVIHRILIRIRAIIRGASGK